MLKLSRCAGEVILIGEPPTVIRLVIMEISVHNGIPNVKLGIDAPKTIPISHRNDSDARRLAYETNFAKGILED